MTIDLERLTTAGLHQLHKMDLDDAAALKLCLLSTGALAGLAIKGSLARRLAGLGCTLLAAGLSVPLVVQYLEELDKTSVVPEPLEEQNEP